MLENANHILSAAANGKLGNPICILDSGATTNHGSSKLIVGLGKGETYSVDEKDADKSLRLFATLIERKDRFAFFTCSYELGAELNKIPTKNGLEPHFWVCLFERVLEYDYESGELHVVSKLGSKPYEFPDGIEIFNKNNALSTLISNFDKASYLKAVEDIQEEIRKGYTYQTNLTQKFSIQGVTNSPEELFFALRNSHPAAFAAFLERKEDHVLSISPERFIRTENDSNGRRIESSPIKGTAPRGSNKEEDDSLRSALVASEKNRAENVMIVDLIRNDLGRVCEFGSVKVEKLYEIETHPTLFHLVSTISGRLREDVRTSDIFRALFPCGSITGCPKISTMKIIHKLEKVPRGLSMGSIGYCNFANELDMNVAIRTLTIRPDEIEFNVGGGVVIDSSPESEYEESLLKAKALLKQLLSDEAYRNIFHEPLS